MGGQSQSGGRRKTPWRAPILTLILLATAACVPLPPAAVTTASPTALTTARPAPLDDPPLVARFTLTPPLIDGATDAPWFAAAPLKVPLAQGIRGHEPAYNARIRALYTADAIYFLAQWPDASAPTGKDQGSIVNKLTIHWTLPPPPAGLAAPACDVACHTAYTDQSGRIKDMRAETIPPGADEALRVAGAWRDGLWTVEWTRPLRSANHNDLQFTDMSAAHPFFLKIFERREGQADPVSGTHQLVFEER